MRMPKRPTYASVAATLALILALGGVSYAAISLPKHSVGPRELAPDAVRAKHIQNGSIERNDLDTSILHFRPLLVAVEGGRQNPSSDGTSRAPSVGQRGGS